MWSLPPSKVSHVTREEPLHPRRVPSVFVNKKGNTAQPMEIDSEEAPVQDAKKVRKLTTALSNLFLDHSF